MRNRFYNPPLQVPKGAVREEAAQKEISKLGRLPNASPEQPGRHKEASLTQRFPGPGGASWELLGDHKEIKEFHNQSIEIT